MRKLYVFIFTLTCFCLNWAWAQNKGTKQVIRKPLPKMTSAKITKQKPLNSRDSLYIDSLSKLIYERAIHENYGGRYYDLFVETKQEGGSRSLKNKRQADFNSAFYTINVNYVTDRNLINSQDDSRTKFGSDRSNVSYGTCTVTIPYRHRIGETESSKVLSLFGENKNKYIYLIGTQIQDEPSFFLELSKNINESTNKSAFIFIHGYNVSFDEAAIRTAQIYKDLNFKGLPIFYSWPSQGNAFKYPTDEANIEWTQTHLEKFLLDFFNKTNADDVYIIAHSMGNRAMIEAINSVVKSNSIIKEKVKELILAAPDVDAETFKENFAPNLIRSCKRITIYGSATDYAIQLSKLFHSYKRLGSTFKGISLTPGIDFIDATGVDTSLLGHSYIATNRSVLVDMSGIINNKLEVSKRFGLDKVDVKPTPYWKFAQ